MASNVDLLCLAYFDRYGDRIDDAIDILLSLLNNTKMLKSNTAIGTYSYLVNAVTI